MSNKNSVFLAALLLAGSHSALAQSQPQPQPQALPQAQPQPLADPAAAFGARESIQSIALSPDGRTIAYVAPTAGQGSALYMAAVDGGAPSRAVINSGDSQQIAGCDFVSNSRLVCEIRGMSQLGTELVSISRQVAVNADGGGVQVLGERDRIDQAYARLSSGQVIDHLPGSQNHVLMAQTFIPETVGNAPTRLNREREGLGVVRVDTTNLRNTVIEQPHTNNVRFITDGRGKVRLRFTRNARGATGMDSPIIDIHYRPANGGDWAALGRFDTSNDTGIWPVAVDPTLNVAYAFQRAANGRDALYRVALDGSGRQEMVVQNDAVDVDGLLRIGRANRVVGASYANERREAVYFDPELRRIAAQFRRAQPNLPLVNFVDASEDESRLLIWAGSDNDPGRYFVYDKAARNLTEIMLARPQLENVRLATVRPITYRAADSTAIPGYLTLPPGVETARGLPAIVMPHGGPGARDEWGFDWLAQYFAHRGFAVLQPNFRGSSGYGDAWFLQNGFRSWRTAVGDVNDAGRWLVAEGMADPAKLAVVGWSYGGYAALQAGVIGPDLYKAVVAIAPVTDLGIARDEWRAWSSGANVRDFFGDGPHIQQGSPARNAGTIKAPVLIFHGENDRNVGVRQSRVMDERLRAAGGRSALVLFPGLDHRIDDSAARAAMLRRADEFLRAALGVR